jgi:putative endonuclease
MAQRTPTITLAQSLDSRVRGNDVVRVVRKVNSTIAIPENLRKHFPMRDEKQPAVYIIASARNGTIYIGVTSALWNRVATHKDKGVTGFSSKYKICVLVWYEHHESMESAIKREKQLKKWNRKWKLELIESTNPTWRDLHDEITFDD